MGHFYVICAPLVAVFIGTWRWRFQMCTSMCNVYVGQVCVSSSYFIHTFELYALYRFVKRYDKVHGRDEKKHPLMRQLQLRSYQACRSFNNSEEYEFFFRFFDIYNGVKIKAKVAKNDEIGCFSTIRRCFYQRNFHVQFGVVYLVAFAGSAWN